VEQTAVLSENTIKPDVLSSGYFGYLKHIHVRRKNSLQKYILKLE
jgi:hypothetical protein